MTSLLATAKYVSGTSNVLANNAILDPVGKLRMSQPQTMIDTDFEYGLQTTKWETLELVNNIPTFYARDNDESLPIDDIVAAKESFNITITTTTPHGLGVGTPLIITGVRSFSAEGAFVINLVTSATSFVYNAKLQQSESGSIYDSYSTTVYVGKMYQGTQYSLDALGYIKTNGGDTIVADTLYPHGFNEGTNFILSRSVGQKQLDATGADIDSRDTLDFDPTTDTLAANGQRSVDTTLEGNNVTIHDWVSKRTLLFANADVDATAGAITIPNHNLTDDDFVMFAPAPYTSSAVSLKINKAETDIANVPTSTFQVSNTSAFTLDGTDGASMSTGGNGMYGGDKNNVTYVHSSPYQPLPLRPAPTYTTGADAGGGTTIEWYHEGNYPYNWGSHRYISTRQLRGTYRNTSTTQTMYAYLYGVTASGTFLLWSNTIVANDLTSYTWPSDAVYAMPGAYSVYYVQMVVSSTGAIAGVNGIITVSNDALLLGAPLSYTTPDYAKNVSTATSTMDYRYTADLAGVNALVIRQTKGTYINLTNMDSRIVDKATADALGATHERNGSYNLPVGAVRCTFYYWGTYYTQATTRPSAYNLYIVLSFSNQTYYPTISPYLTPNASNRTSSFTMIQSIDSYATQYAVKLLQSRTNGARITYSDMQAVVTAVANNYRKVVGLFDVYSMPRSLRFTYGGVDDFSMSSDTGAAPAFVNGTRISANGVQLSYQQRFYQSLDTANVAYKMFGQSIPHICLLRVLNNATTTIRVLDVDTGSTTGTRLNYSTVAYRATYMNTFGNQYNSLVWWGLYGNSNSGGVPQPNVYHVIIAWSNNNYPVIANMGSTSSVASMDTTVRITPNTSITTYIATVTFAMPAGSPVPSTQDFYNMSDMLLAWEASSNPAPILTGASSESSANFSSVISGLVGHELYGVSRLDADRVRLRAVTKSTITTLGGGWLSGAGGNVSYGNFDTTFALPATFTTSTVNFPAFDGNNFLSQAYSGGFYRYTTVYMVDTDDVSHQVGTQRYWTTSFYLNTLPQLILPVVKTFKAIRLVHTGETYYISMYLYAPGFRWYATPMLLGAFMSPAATDTGAVSHKHALHKALPIIDAHNNVVSAQRLSTDTMPVLPSGEKAWLFSTPGSTISGLVRSTDNLDEKNYRTYVLTNVVGRADRTDFNVTYLGSLQGASSGTFPSKSWVIVGRDLAYRNSMYLPSHGMVEDTAVQVVRVAGSSGIPNLGTGLTFYASVVDANNIRFKGAPGAAGAVNFTMTDGALRTPYSLVNAAANSVSIPDHGLMAGMQVEYTSVTDGVGIQGLTSGTTYTTFNVSKDRFQLSTNTTSAVNLTADPSDPQSIHRFFVKSVGATDGTYVITNVDPGSTIITLQAPFVVPPKRVVVVPRSSVNTSANTLYLPGHRMSTGSTMAYVSVGQAGVAIGGLELGREYNVIRLDANHVRLATSFLNAIAGVTLELQDVGEGDSHELLDFSIGGETVSTSTVNITAGSTTVTGAVDATTGLAITRFLSEFRVGNTFNVVVPDPLADDYTVTSVDGVTFTLTLNKAVTFATGAPVVYAPAFPNKTTTLANSGTIASLTPGRIYYSGVAGTNMVRLHPTLADAVANSNPVPVASASTLGVLATNIPASVFRAVVVDILSNKSMVLGAAAPSTATVCSYLISTNMLVKADGFALHRPYDGGVELIPPKNADSQMIRQTRKYFRYQSGKGIQVSLAINFSAPVTVERLYRDGDGVGHVVTRRPHRLSEDVYVTFRDSSDQTWNRTCQVLSVTDLTSFTVSLGQAGTPTSVNAPGLVSMTVDGWNNSKLRCGLFDDQNGLFFEYDGERLYAVRRSSVTQLTGTASVTFNSPVVVGVGASFTSQLVPRQRIVIKGQTYKVVSIASDNLLYVQPVYRGLTKRDCIVTRTDELRAPQSEWHDPCDGTGDSGYNIDIHKIQMAYMDYSWYGAGKVRFGFRLTDGSMHYVHSFIHNNVQTEAYFRSGNLPCRYEVENVGFPSYTPALMHWGTSVIMDGRFDDDKSYLFTGSGQVLTYVGSSQLTVSSTLSVNNIGLGQYNRWFYVYDTSTGRNVYAFAIAAPISAYSSIQNVRSGSGISGTALQSGTRTVSQPQPQSTSHCLIYIDRAPTGSFTGGSHALGNAVRENIPNIIPLVSIRLAPSVDNSMPGPMGSREILNRMQLILRDLGILTSHDVEVKLLLNGFVDNKSWERVTPPSLSQLVYHRKDDAVDGGTVIFSFRVSGGQAEASGRRAPISTMYEIGDLVSLGNSILGGDGIYPDGPDLLTVCVSLLDSAGITLATPFVITSRVTWAESQA